uniref:Uncharacterized protein n=1 Tax=Setaria viridis TaxID=4556 RepID=A0A4U6TUK9_SETVI|nr:hypothetical protein SEVIR_7G162900v2 [Setaria viridis]
MPPPCVLLNRKVIFVSGGTPVGSSEDVERSTGGPSKAAAAIGSPAASMEAILQAMKPDPAVDCMHGGIISSTDKALVVLYAGHYRPGCSHSPSSGCYLVYDASSNSLSAVPQLPDSYSFRALGRGAAILSRGKGEYLLAELVATTSGFPDGALYLWQCPSPSQGQWMPR